MSTPGIVVAPPPPVHASRRGSVFPDRLFYVVAAGLMLILTAVGFRAFYLHGRAFGGGHITSEIVPLVVAHGIAMSGWAVLFFVQSVLILTGKRRLHMVAGPAGGVVAAGNVVLGAAVAVLSVRWNPDIYRPFGGPEFFLAQMLTSMAAFGILVGVGLRYRRQAEIHRPMMLLATVVTMSGSLGRFPYVANLAPLAPLYIHGPTLLFGGLLLLLQWGMSGAPSRWYAAGYVALALVFCVALAVGSSAAWAALVAALVLRP